MTLSSEFRLRYDDFENLQLIAGEDSQLGLWRGLLGADLRLNPSLHHSELGIGQVDRRRADSGANFKSMTCCGRCGFQAYFRDRGRARSGQESGMWPGVANLSEWRIPQAFAGIRTSARETVRSGKKKPQPRTVGVLILVGRGLPKSICNQLLVKDNLFLFLRGCPQCCPRAR